MRASFQFKCGACIEQVGMGICEKGVWRKMEPLSFAESESMSRSGQIRLECADTVLLRKYLWLFGVIIHLALEKYAGISYERDRTYLPLE